MNATRVVIIGSTRKHTGKTTLVCRSLELLDKDVPRTAVKITPLEDMHTAETLTGTLQKGSFDILVQQSKFILIQISESSGGKILPAPDTDRYIASGAESVYWLLTDRKALMSAWENTCEYLPAGVVFVESTSLGLLLRNKFLVISDTAGHSDEKELAKQAKLRADWVLDPDSALYGSWYLCFHQNHFSLDQNSPSV